MSKFNTIVKETNEIKNHEGAAAYAMTPELELYTAAVTASLSNMFYEKADERVERIAKLVGRVSPEFVARLAVYTRTEMNLRSVPLLLLVELAKIHNGDDLVARAVEKTVLRADEIMELLMCYQWRNPSSDPRKKLGKLSRQIQNGLQRAFNRFDEYQFAKYDRDNLEVKLRDALFLVHPKAKDERQQALFDKIADRNLETPYTWETELSALGQKQFASDEERQEAFREKWEELIDSGKLGYMAMMRNLRNMLQSDVSMLHINDVASRLADAEQVAKSKQLPFRFLSAYREIMNVDSVYTSKILSALETAVKASVENLEGFDADTNVLLAADVSGSMQHSVSPRSSVQNYDIGILLSMLLQSKCQSVISGIFGDTWKVINLPQDNILANTCEMHRREGEVGYSTNGYKVVDYLVKKKIRMDKVMIFTDCQMWDSDRGYLGTYEEEIYGTRGKHIKDSWHRYKAMFPEAKLYLFDLAGYGQPPMHMAERDVYLIAGWSDRVFDILTAVDNGEDALSVINKIEI